MLRRILIGLAILATLIAIFYAEEDWRGKRAWENCKRDLEAKGAVLDWDKFIPPPVPDDQNFFKAPKMADWFQKKTPGFTGSFTNEFTGDFYASLEKYRAKNNPILVAELTIEPPAANFESTRTNVVFKFDDVQARRHALEFIRDNVGSSTMGAQGFTLMAKPLYQIRPVRLIFQAEKLPALNEISALFPNNIVPASLGNLRIEAGVESNSFRVWINPFPALPNSASVYAASDFLEWSDGFNTNFDLIREALKRPYTQMDGDYTQPFAMPIPNFVAARFLAQTLASRAQCYFLLGQPERALREVTLLNDSRRIQEGAPTGQPMTLVAAMINVAIAKVYVDTIADGLQQHAWREPQLVALQEQLKGINLPPFIIQSFESEPAALCRELETTGLRKIMSMASGAGDGRSIWQKIKDLKFHKYDLYDLVPRGWVYQNMALIARLDRPQDEGFDLVNNLIRPGIFKELARRMDAAFSGNAKPYYFLAAIFSLNITKATQTLAHNQTLANEAQIACALERYRLAHGEYPETLDALVPQFIEKLPHDIIGGQPSQSSGSASQPLHYRRTDPPSQGSGAASGKFLLYSVGWNETDNGGIASDKMDQGDWVWQYPVK